MITLSPVSQYSGASSTCTVTLPAINVYLKDANFVSLKFEAENSPVNYCNATLQFIDNNDVVLKRYSAQVYGDILTINIGSLFNSPNLTTDEVYTLYLNRIVLTGSITCENGDAAEFSTNLGAGLPYKVYDGYSLPNRAHGTDTAVFTPPSEIGSSCVSMIATTNSIVNDGKGGIQYVEAGQVFSVCKPDDGCMSRVDVDKLVMRKSWDKTNRSWNFGINYVIIDRVLVDNDDFGILKLLEDVGGFDTTDLLYSRYSPLSVILEATEDVGVWRISFFSNIEEDGQRHIVWLDNKDGHMFYLKEEGDRSLFAHDWNDYNYATTAPQFKCYYAPIWQPTGYEIFDYTPVDFTIRPYVAYDNNTYSDPDPDYTTFSNTNPLCAIRFCTTYGLDSIITSDYDYVVNINDERAPFDAYAQFWMFGNHLPYSNPKDAEMNWFMTDPDAIVLYGTVNEVGCGIDTLIVEQTEEFHVPGWNGWYSVVAPNTDAKLQPHDCMWYHLWAFFNNNPIRLPNLYEWSGDDFSHTYIKTLNGARKYKKNIDYAATLPGWTYGSTIIDMYNVEATLKFSNETICVIPAGHIQFYPVYTFKNTYAPTYQTSLIKLFDGIDYYHYDGTTTTEEYADNVRFTFDLSGWPDLFFSTDYCGNIIMIDNNFVDTFEGVGGMDVQYFRVMELSHATYGAFYYMPFVCGIPFIRRRENDECAQFSRLTLVIEDADYNPTYVSAHQILQVDRYYDTLVNLGSFGQVQTQNISKESRVLEPANPPYYRDSDLTNNSNIYSRYVNITNLFSSREWDPSLHIEGFNSYGTQVAPYLYSGDGSFVMLDGCEKKQGADGDITNGTVYGYTAYVFDTCSINRVVWIKYKNMDGLWRYLPAEVIEQTYTNSRQDLQRLSPIESPINAYPLWKPYALQEKITVFLSNIPTDMHIEDILYSTPLMLYSFDGTIPCYVSLEEDTINRDLREDSENFVLHFIKKH